MNDTILYSDLSPHGLSGTVNAIYNDTDTDHDIGVIAGLKFFDSSGLKILTTTAMVKRIDASWSAGTGNGGLYSGSILSANTTYYLFMLYDSSSKNIDYVFYTGPTLNSLILTALGFTHYVRIWSVITDSSANIINFSQYGKKCIWSEPITDLALQSNPGSDVKTNLSITTPYGVSTESILDCFGYWDGEDYFTVYISNPDFLDIPVSLISCNIICGASNFYGYTKKRITQLTDTQSQISYKKGADDTDTYFGLNTVGYTDFQLQ